MKRALIVAAALIVGVFVWLAVRTIDLERLGVFEGAEVVALVAFDVDASVALSHAFVLHAVNFVPYLAGGLLVLPANGLTGPVLEAVTRGCGASGGRGRAPRRRLRPLSP